MNLLEFAYQHPVATATVILGTSAFVAVVTKLIKELLASILKQIGKFVFVSVKLEDEQDRQVVSAYLRQHCRSIGMGNDVVSYKTRYVRGRGSVSVFFRNMTKTFELYWFRGAPIFLTPRGQGQDDEDKEYANLRFIRGTVNVKDLFRLIGESYDSWRRENMDRKFKIVKLSGMGSPEEGKISTNESGAALAVTYGEFMEPLNIVIEELRASDSDSALDVLSHTEAHTALIHDVRFWLKHQQWYEDRDLTWRRGYILYGPPGTGKTSLIRAICKDEDIPVFVFDLTSMNNAQFNRAWEWVKQFTPRAILLEDFDTVFKGRQNVSIQGELDFSTLLNALDGIEQENGMLLFVTTNHPEHIDDAFGQPLPNGGTTRPGRLDVAINIPPLDYAGRLKIAKRIVEDPVDAEKMVGEGADDSPAQLTERCKMFALQALWENGTSDGGTGVVPPPAGSTNGILYSDGLGGVGLASFSNPQPK